MQGLNIIENSTICDGDLEIGISPSQIAKNIAAGEMYIVKNVFNADDLRTMTMDVFHGLR